MGGSGACEHDSATGEVRVFRNHVFWILAIGLLSCFGCGGDTVDDGAIRASGPDTVWDVAAAEEDLSHWLDAARAGGLEDVLSGPGPITVFAPTNAAFEAWQAAQGDGKFDAALSDESVIGPIVQSHVMDGRVSGEQIFRRRTLETWGGSVPVVISNDMATIGGAMISSINLEAVNGVIHIVEAMVIVPE